MAFVRLLATGEAFSAGAFGNGTKRRRRYVEIRDVFRWLRSFLSQYYLHIFAPEQPDLNWENPEVRKASFGSSFSASCLADLDSHRLSMRTQFSFGSTKVRMMPGAFLSATL